MSVKLKRYVTNTNSYRENGSLSDDIFTRNILRHNCFMFKYSVKKAVNEITARQTRTGLYIHDVIIVCSIEYLTTQIELVLCQLSYNSRTVYKIMDYLTLRLLSSLWNIYHSTKACFFDPPCQWRRQRGEGGSSPLWVDVQKLCNYVYALQKMCQLLGDFVL